MNSYYSYVIKLQNFIYVSSCFKVCACASSCVPSTPTYAEISLKYGHVWYKAAAQQDTATFTIYQDKKKIHKKGARFKLLEEFRLTKENNQIIWDGNIITPYSCEMCHQLSNEHTKSRLQGCFHIQKCPGRVSIPGQKVSFIQSQRKQKLNDFLGW